MAGIFGGYGGFVRAEKGKTSYELVAAVDGKSAITVKVIVFMPGCEIVTLSIAVEDAARSRKLICKPLAYIHLRGQISPASMVQDQSARVEVTYQVLWAHQFYGISDGPVTSVPIATVVPDGAGNFEVDIPDFSAQKLGNADFELVLRAAKSGNILAFLEPQVESRNREVLSSYPPLVTFVARTPQPVVPH